MNPTGKKNRGQQLAEQDAKALEQVRQRREEKEKEEKERAEQEDWVGAGRDLLKRLLKEHGMDPRLVDFVRDREVLKSFRYYTDPLLYSKGGKEDQSSALREFVSTLEHRQRDAQDEGKPKKSERKLPGKCSAEEAAAYKRAGDRGVYDSTYAKPEKKKYDMRKGAERAETLEERLAEIQGELKQRNEQLRQENATLKQELQERMFMRSFETRRFVDFWVQDFIAHDYLISSLFAPKYNFQTIDRGRIIWMLPDLIGSKLASAYGGSVDSVLVNEISKGIFDRLLTASIYPPIGVSYPPMPNMVVAGRDVNIYSGQSGVGAPTAPAPQVSSSESVQGPVHEGVAEQEPEPESVQGPVHEGVAEQEPEPESVQGRVREGIAEIPETPEDVVTPGMPKDVTVKDVLEALIDKYSIEAGKGYIRGGVLPLAGALGGSFGFQSAMGMAGLAGPGVGAAAAGLGSLVSSAIRRKMGENSFSLWSRYSHVEKQGGIWGGIKTTFRYIMRGPERFAMKKILGLEGKSKRLFDLVRWHDADYISPLTLQKLKGDKVELKKYVEEALWYATAINTIVASGAYLHDSEKTEWQQKADKVLAMANQLLQDTGYKHGDEKTNKLLHDISNEIEEKEGMKYWTQATAMAGIGAAKAFITAGLINWGIGKAKEVFAHPTGAGPSGAPPEGAPVGQAPVGQAPGGPVPIEGLGNTVPVQETLGHTFQHQGFNANLLWRGNTGLPILRKIGELNTDNENMWKQLWWFATKSRGLAPGTMNHLRELLVRAGVDGTKGDFIADPSIFGPGKLSYNELLDMFRYTGRAVGVEANVLGGNALQMGMPDAIFVNQVSGTMGG